MRNCVPLSPSGVFKKPDSRRTARRLPTDALPAGTAQSAIADEVLDGSRSAVLHQARNRMSVQMAVLYRLLKEQ